MSDSERPALASDEDAVLSGLLDEFEKTGNGDKLGDALRRFLFEWRVLPLDEHGKSWRRLIGLLVMLQNAESTGRGGLEGGRVFTRDEARDVLQGLFLSPARLGRPHEYAMDDAIVVVMNDPRLLGRGGNRMSQEKRAEHLRARIVGPNVVDQLIAPHAWRLPFERAWRDPNRMGAGDTSDRNQDSGLHLQQGNM